MKIYMYLTTISLLALLATAGTGCRMVDPPREVSQPWTPPDWAREEQKEDPVWDSLRDKTIDTSGPLTLIKCADIALMNNPATRQSWASARVSAAQVGQAESLLYPQVTVSGQGTYLKQKYTMKDDQSGTVNVPDSDEFNYGPALELTYLLFDFGGVRGGIEEARQILLAANYSFNQSIQDLLFDVEKAYYTLHSSRSELEAAEADVADTRTAYEAARQKFEVGLSSKLDELQTRSSYEDSLYNLEVARGNVETGKAGLAEVLGLPADAVFTIAPPARELPTEISDADVSGLIEEGLRRRPDIASLRAQLRAQEAAVDVTGSLLWPSLNLGGSANKLWYSYREDPELYDDSYLYTGYVSLNWDIFTGFSDREKKRQAEAQAEVAREQLASAELQASAEVWTKFYAFNTAVKKYTFSQAFLETSRESYDLALESYNAGLKSILDLLQSQSDLSSARSQLVGSEKDLFIALADLAHATGSLTLESITAGATEKRE
ncbi:MAG: TolC family protein [PVC group bacterium]